MTRFNKIFLFLLILNGGLFSQSDELQDQRQELETIRDEIKTYEQQLKAKQSEKKSATELLAGLNREIDLTVAHLKTLRNEIQATEAEIQNSSARLSELQDKISDLRELIKKRLVRFYKYGRRHRYQLLFQADSWQQVNVWLRYQKMIVENDRRNIQSLMAARDELAATRQRLVQQNETKKQLLAEQQEEIDQLQQSRRKRAVYVESLQNDAQYLQSHVRQLRAAQNQIREIIVSSEQRRQQPETTQLRQRQSAPEPLPADDAAFASLRGKMIWPAKGDIIAHFGRYRHPTLKTITENLGIEIKAPLNSPVRAVDTGRVQTITWQRGRGNIVILEHDNGYYTVYTHLAEINVQVGDAVAAGKAIGSVGESGSLHGPVLHFQIWKNTENLDPEPWLM